MNLYFRFFFLLFVRLVFCKKTSVFDAVLTTFRVNPLDLDLNLHMNNGRYLSVMDLGRIDLMLRSGSFWPLLKSGYYPVVSSESIRFKKSLELFQKFSIETKIDSWDERNFFMRQKFLVADDIVAEGYIKGRFKKRGRSGSVSTSEVFERLRNTLPNPSLSALAQSQNNIERLLSSEARPSERATAK